jgi:hypothetical protein
VCRSKAAQDFEEQYQSLMSAKPAPVPLAAVRTLGFGDGDEIFDEVPSDTILENTQETED